MSEGPPAPGSIEELKARWMEESAPRISVAELPKGDQARARQLELSFDLLTSFIDEFKNDVALFDYANTNNVVEMKWVSIACRDAAMNLWNFSDALSHIHTVYRRCKSVQSAARLSALILARETFDNHFPHAETMRDKTAHPVGHLASRGRENLATQGQVIVHNSWAGRRVINTHQGREISFDISTETVDSLRFIRKLVFDGFR